METVCKAPLGVDSTVIRPEGKSDRDEPRGFYKRFYATPKMIFGDNPDERVRRQTVYFETYLDILSELLQKKLLLLKQKSQ